MHSSVAPNVQNLVRGKLVPRPLPALPPMNRDFQIRFTAILLALVTAAAATLAWINFQKESEFQIPYDGVWWIERNGTLTADRVETDGPADKAGIRNGDNLLAVNQHEVNSTAALVHQLYRAGAWSKATYSLQRASIPLDSVVILVPVERSLNQWLRLIALIYLGIGVYVLLRRWTAPGSTHFYIFCLVSFVFYSFKYTGKFNQFDWTIYWGNVAAWLLQPALFLHFVLTFPEERGLIRKNRWALPLIYMPGALLLGVHVFAFQFLKASERLRWNLDRIQMGYLARILCRGSRSSLVQLSSCQHTNSQTAVKVGDSRHDSCHHAIHSFLRDPLSVRGLADRCDESFCAVARVAASDFRLCHFPIPVDGC